MLGSIVVAIDPSIRKLGIAIGNINGDILTAGTLYNKEHSRVDYRIRAHHMATKVCEIVTNMVNHSALQETRVGFVVSEVPENWASGRGAASKDAEGIQRLYYGAGAVLALLGPLAGELWAVTPRVWKGQTPKPIMMNRAAAVYNAEYPSDDCAEAVLLLHEFCKMKNISSSNSKSNKSTKGWIHIDTSINDEVDDLLDFKKAKPKIA